MSIARKADRLKARFQNEWPGLTIEATTTSRHIRFKVYTDGLHYTVKLHDFIDANTMFRIVKDEVEIALVRMQAEVDYFASAG